MDTAFDLEVEQAVLGAFLIDDSTSWSRIGVFFCPEPFYVQDHLNDVNNSCRSAEVVVALAQLRNRNLHVSATDLDVSVTSGHSARS
jgi:replicative DNA helicase